MPVVVKRVANEPVLIATLSGFVTVDDIITMYEETAKHFANYDGHIYRITDTRGVDSSFSDLMMILAEARKKEGFTTNSGKVTAIIVGENEWARMTREAMRQILKEIQSGAFAEEWMDEYHSGGQVFYATRGGEQNQQLEVVGKQLRRMMTFLNEVN